MLDSPLDNNAVMMFGNGGLLFKQLRVSIVQTEDVDGSIHRPDHNPSIHVSRRKEERWEGVYSQSHATLKRSSPRRILIRRRLSGLSQLC